MLTHINVKSYQWGIWSRTIIDFAVLVASEGQISVRWVGDGAAETTDDCDIIVKSHFTSGDSFGTQQVPYICWSGESYQVPSETTHAPFMYIDTLQLPEEAERPTMYFYVPLVAIAFNYSKYKRNGESVKEFEPSHRRPFFVAYCNSNPQKHREEMFRILQGRNGEEIVHGLGKCSHTEGVAPVTGSWSSGELLSRYSSYRFVFAMENLIGNQTGVVSEKIVNAYASGAIPIFWGCSSTAKALFNPKSFVCVNDFSSFVECADFIEKLDKDEERYNAMVNEPMFTNGIVPPIMQMGDTRCSSDTYLRIGKAIIQQVEIGGVHATAK